MRKFDGYRAAAIADPRFYEPFERADLGDDLLVAARAFAGDDVVADGIWARCTPSGLTPLPSAGWKIHVSATPARAAETLAAVGRVYRRGPFHFKCLLSNRLVSFSSARWWHPGQVGKVVAIYATDADHARALLEELHTETEGLPGPYVLTDKRYRDSTCLYYRYGQFRKRSRLNPDGTSDLLVAGPDGQLWVDDRSPIYRRPPWVSPLFDDEDAPPDSGGGLHGYRVLKSLRYGGCGGTYLAERQSDGMRVVLKEARPNTGYADDGSDAQERLRREFEALQKMAGTGVAPRPVELFTEWEHLFLAEEYLGDTVPLVHLVAKYNPLPRNDNRPDVMDRYHTIIDKVVAGVRAAIDACHERGMVYGDLSLTNVLVCPETFRVWLIDFESVRGLDGPQDKLPRTPGFSPPPGSAARSDGRAFDHFGVAAVELALLMPRNTLRTLNPPALARATRHAAALLRRPVEDVLARLELDAPTTELDLRTVAEGAMRFAEAVMTPERADRLFPADLAVFTTNAVSVANGAAGVLRAMHRITGRFPDEVREWLRNAKLDDVPPGLYSGLAGLGWTLCDAGEAEWGAEVVGRAVENAATMSLPVGIMNGHAGVGMACLGAWSRVGDASFLDTAARIGDLVAESAKDSGLGLYWAQNGGGVPVGYGNGSAGVALFLLYLHLATGEMKYLRLGRRALAHDVGQGVDEDNGVLAFPAKVGGDVYYPYWERGAAGVGAVLARYCTVVDDEHFRSTLDRIVRHDVGGISISPALFNGMGGPANLALDYADLYDAPEFRVVATRMANAVAALAAEQPEGIAFPGTSLLRYSTDFATGSAGAALVLHRVYAGGGDFNYTLDGLLPPRLTASAAVEVAGHA
jgi:tRNA A-37 threonylcarbamoyl transferase component Bud32